MASGHDPMTASGTDKTNGKSSSMGSIRERLSEAAGHLRHTAGDYGRSAAESIDRNVHSAAGAVEKTATTLRSQAPASGKVSELAMSAAGKLDSTALYLREYHTDQMISAAESWTRRNPVQALGAAAAIGFLLGMTMRKDRTTY